MPSVPIAAVFSVQGLLVVAVFAALISVFAVQMQQQTVDLVSSRLEAQLSGLRASILEPYMYAVNAVEQIVMMSTADPDSMRISDAKSPADDYDFCRMAGTSIKSTGGYVMYVSEFYEQNVIPNQTYLSPADGMPLLSRIFVSPGLQLKVYNGNMSIYLKEAATVTKSVFESQYLVDNGPFPWEVDPIYDNRLNDVQNVRYWTHYPYASPSDGKIYRAGVYSVNMNNTKFFGVSRGIRYANKWMFVALVNLSSITAMMSGLTDGPNSFASLYDVNSRHATKQIIASTDPSVETIRTVAGTTDEIEFTEAHESGSERMDRWFSTCYAMSTGGSVVKEFDVVRVDKRFVSYSHIRFEDALHLFAFVSTPEERYFADADRVRNTMIGVGIACAVVILLICIFILLAIRLPLGLLIQNMGLAAVLKTSEVVPMRSYLTDIDVICETFFKMNTMLDAARAFLPASLIVKFTQTDTEGESDEELEHDEEGEEEEEYSGDEYDGSTTLTSSQRSLTQGSTVLVPTFESGTPMAASTKYGKESSAFTASALDRLNGGGGPRKKGKKGGLTKKGLATARAGHNDLNSHSLNTTGNTTTNSGSHTLNKDGSKRIGAQNLVLTNSGSGGQIIDASSLLKNRRVALLVVNVRGFTALSDFAISSLCAHSSALLDMMQAAADGEKGIIDSFHGDHFVISFNAIKTAASPARKAVQCSFAIASALSTTSYKALSMGAASGNAIVGPLGNSTQRRMSIVGACYTKALKLQTASATLEKSVDPLFGFPRASRFTGPSCFNCLIDAATYNDCRDSCATMLVGCFAPAAPLRTTAAGVSAGADRAAAAGAAGSPLSAAGAKRTTSINSTSRGPKSGGLIRKGNNNNNPTNFDATSRPISDSEGHASVQQIRGVSSKTEDFLVNALYGADASTMDRNTAETVRDSNNAVTVIGGGQSVLSTIPGVTSSSVNNNNNNNNTAAATTTTTVQTVNKREAFDMMGIPMELGQQQKHGNPILMSSAAGGGSGKELPFTNNGRPPRSQSVSFSGPVGITGGPIGLIGGGDSSSSHIVLGASPSSPLNAEDSTNGIGNPLSGDAPPAFHSPAVHIMSTTNNTNNNSSMNGSQMNAAFASSSPVKLIGGHHSNSRSISYGAGTAMTPTNQHQQQQQQQQQYHPSGMATFHTPTAPPAPSSLIYATLKTDGGAKSFVGANALKVTSTTTAAAGGGKKRTTKGGGAAAIVDDEAEEWMYEMQKKTDAQPLKDVTYAVECAQRGQWDALGKALGDRLDAVRQVASVDDFMNDTCMMAPIGGGMKRQTIGASWANEASGVMDPTASSSALSVSTAASSVVFGTNKNRCLNAVLHYVSMTYAQILQQQQQQQTNSSSVQQHLLHHGNHHQRPVIRPQDLRISFPNDLLYGPFTGSGGGMGVGGAGGGFMSVASPTTTTPTTAANNNVNTTTISMRNPPSPEALLFMTGLSGLDALEAAEVAAWLRLIGLLEAIGVGAHPQHGHTSFITATTIA